MGKCPRRTVPRTRPCPSSWVSSGQGGRCMWIGPRVGAAGGKSSEKEPGDLVCCGGATSELDPSGPSLSLSSVTLEWEVLIFDPQESVQFRDLHLYHPDASQTHTRLVLKPQAEGPAPSSLCGSTSQRGLESPADASPARSPESCPPEQSSAPPSALHPGAGLARCSW